MLFRNDFWCKCVRCPTDWMHWKCFRFQLTQYWCFTDRRSSGWQRCSLARRSWCRVTRLACAQCWNWTLCRLLCRYSPDWSCRSAGQSSLPMLLHLTLAFFERCTSAMIQSQKKLQYLKKKRKKLSEMFQQNLKGFWFWSYKLTFVAVEAIKGCVVTVASIGRISFNALTTVSTRYCSIEALSCAIPPYALCFIYFSL